MLSRDLSALPDPQQSERQRASAPFAALGTAAIIAGGIVAAAVAHRPVQPLVWMSAYLVLIVGVAQIVFGEGQASLATRAPGVGLVWGQWLVFNLGNTGVILGTLAGSFAVVFAGTLLFAAGVALFLFGTRAGRHRGWLWGYRVVLALVFVSSLVGLGLSAAANVH